MKRALFSLLAGLVSLSLSGCTLSLLGTPTTAATATLSLPTPTPFTSATQTVQKTPSPTLRPTETPVPTEAIPNFYPGLAPTLEQFTKIGSTADISKIIARLRSQPSLLTEGSDPISTAIAQGNSVAIACNGYGDINCAVAASVKVMDQGQWRWLTIIELRNGDGSRGYLTGYIYDPVEQTGTKAYERMVANPTEPFAFLIFRDVVFHPYEEYNKLRPGVSELIEQLLQTQTVPPPLEDKIINISRS